MDIILLAILFSIWYVSALSLLRCLFFIILHMKLFHSLSYSKNNATYIFSCIVCVVVENCGWLVFNNYCIPTKIHKQA
jgi:hypothetical protein